jgi:hypothetical protein
MFKIYDLRELRTDALLPKRVRFINYLKIRAIKHRSYVYMYIYIKLLRLKIELGLINVILKPEHDSYSTTNIANFFRF